MIRALILAFACLGALSALADDAGGAPADTPAAAAALLQLAGEDTIRTNLWVAEALMGEAAREVIRALPPPPARVVLVPHDQEQACALLTTMVTGELRRAGYEAHLDQAPADSLGEPAPAAGYQLSYQVLELGVTYPETGRRLGIWRQWVGRRLSFTGLFTLVETPGGRVLFNDRVQRSYRDRVPSDDLADCQHPAYAFTLAEPQESGWQRKVEEVVVLGALAGLIAIYFANTD